VASANAARIVNFNGQLQLLIGAQSSPNRGARSALSGGKIGESLKTGQGHDFLNRNLPAQQLSEDVIRVRDPRHAHVIALGESGPSLEPQTPVPLKGQHLVIGAGESFEFHLTPRFSALSGRKGGWYGSGLLADSGGEAQVTHGAPPIGCGCFPCRPPPAGTSIPPGGTGQ